MNPNHGEAMGVELIVQVWSVSERFQFSIHSCTFRALQMKYETWGVGRDRAGKAGTHNLSNTPLIN